MIITATGWLNKGTNLKGAFPSEVNALKYFINVQQWSKEEKIDMRFFLMFDEFWKVGADGDDGIYWSI
ncbi:hypothetical protein [Winogradskyella bathintestinalis]|uniref:Uncharacterized protein n=1 Tax=Winogradskyella bathintestinalis TaxID=3035208 RepID=A0ABT7ZZG7_9FLAO|nr:hypothetical protein [Winogradskyella bathintestinalis]MDN3494138.1 hypothetical protein [Winogradskyella bathintestinalis]